MRLAPGATRFAWAAAALAALGLLVSPWLSLAALAAGGFALWFHRDPERDVAESGIVAPADGRVRAIEEGAEGVRVSTFMNVTDVHVNRAPLADQIESVEHTPGGHRPAFAKSAERNESVRVAFEAYEVVLIAGAFARRITPYVEAGEEVERGERIGHISFGSRVDVVLPAGVDREEVRVEAGESVRAGETVIAPEP